MLLACALTSAAAWAAAEVPASALEKTYVARRVIYLLGTLDIDPDHPAPDKSCMAEADADLALRPESPVRCAGTRERF
jgi:hypothetical protein